MPCGCSPKSGPDFDPDFEGPSCDDLDRFGSDTVTCPECGEEVYYDAAICPQCGHAIIAARSGKSGHWKAPLITGAAIVALAAFVLAFVL
jgi:hypothetical protein